MNAARPAQQIDTRYIDTELSLYIPLNTDYLYIVGTKANSTSSQHKSKMIYTNRKHKMVNINTQK